jgi:eukaryotic-like serine/threonine-protein kinase
MIAVGETVGNYRVAAKLGEGGMGQVFLAEHPVIGSKVAIKAVHSHFARNPDVVSRFVTEARAVNQVGHEHIVSITDFGTTPAGDFYFVMEYLQGQMLSDEIGRPFAPGRALNIATQIADALQASHEQGVIHRDLKPGNVLLVEREGTPDFVKVFDFGLAKLIGKDGTVPTHSTGAGIVMGTPFYMSPEQCAGNVEVDQRCDIYALGVILFEMLTGCVPFTGDGYGEVMLKHVNQAPPSACALVPTLPPTIDEILHRAMAKMPAERFQTMAELRLALMDVAAMFSAPPLPTSRPRRLSGPSEILPGTGELIQTESPRPKHKHRGMFLAGAAALAVAAVANVGFRRAGPATAAAGPAASHAAANPATVRVNFTSDPDGATVSRKDGTVLGLTPLSTQMPYNDGPVEVVIQKAGFQSKTVAFVPNMPIPVLAVLRKDPARTGGPAPQTTAPPPRPRATARPAVASTPPAQMPTRSARARDIDRDDDVMAPTTW